MKSNLEFEESVTAESRQPSSLCAWKRPASLTRLVGIAGTAIALLAFGVAQAASSGPASGGNTLTINGTALGNGSDITNVTICGVMAVIQNQTANSVTVVTGRAEDGGTGDIKVYSASFGVTTFTNGYTYNPPSAIFGPFKGWLSVSNLPVARSALAAVSVKAKIYAIGGYNRSYQSAVNVYDPSQPKLGWSSVSNLPAALYGMGAASVNGKIYSIGGYDGSSDQSTVYVYDPSRPTLGWLTVSNLPAARSGLAAASVNSKIYAIGGSNVGGNAQSIVYVYDPSQPMLGWLSASNLPARRFGSAAANVNGNIYAIGGYDGVIYQSTVYEGAFATAVTPSSGLLTGGNAVTISGNNLGKGDVTSVTLCSVPAIILSDNSPTQILVRAGAAAIPAIGDVMVNSTSYGVTVKSNAYTYQPPPTITTSNSLPPGMVGTVYNQTLTASGGATPYTWSIISGGLPSGLNLSTNGVISGMPTVATNASFTVQVTDASSQIATNLFSLTVKVTMTVAFDGTHLQLSWPTNCLGWELQAQTNPAGAGLGTNWFPVADSTNNTQMSIPIDPNNPSVFYRLHQQ